MHKSLVSEYNCVVGKSFGLWYIIFIEVFCATCMPLIYVCGAPPPYHYSTFYYRLLIRQSIYFWISVRFEIAMPYYRMHIIYVILNLILKYVCSIVDVLIEYNYQISCMINYIYVRTITLFVVFIYWCMDLKIRKL